MNNGITLLLDIIIIVAPIIGYFPQIIKVIKRKTDHGFNSLRVTLLYYSTFTEMFLNLAFNRVNDKDYSNDLEIVNKNARLLSLAVAWIGILLKLYVKTKYSYQPEIQYKHNKAVLFFTVLLTLILTPIIIVIPTHTLVLILSIIASLFNLASYLPQINETYTIKKSGSLSYLSILFDYIGNICIIFFLNLSNQLKTLILIPLIVSHISILILLGLMIWFDNRYMIINWYNRRRLGYTRSLIQFNNIMDDSHDDENYFCDVLNNDDLYID